MKLKLVVASMSLLTLSLISGPAALAADATDGTVVAPVKKAKRHHRVRPVVMREYDYKGMGALPVQPVAVLETCLRTGFYDTVIDAMHQNLGRAKPTYDCNRPIAFAGGINFDAQWGNRHLGYMGENVRRVSVNDAYLNVYGNVNEWTKAFMSISYSNPSVMIDPNKTAETPANPKLGKYSNVYNTSDSDTSSFKMEQAYITVGNMDVYPLFLTLGRQFQDYGRYQIHPMTRSLAQVLSETLVTSANVGFVTNFGLHGSAAVFDNSLKQVYGETVVGQNGTLTGHTTPDWIVSLGFDQPNDLFGYDLGLGYIYNMTTVNDVAFGVAKFRQANGAAATNTVNGYTNRVGAVAAYGDVNSGPFSLSARYTSALQHFSPKDLATKITNGGSARPWAADVSAGYNFNGWWGRNNNVYLGYQASRDAVALFLPQGRWLAGYNVEVWKNTNFAIEGNHDIDYNSNAGGTGGTNNTVTVRVAVKFG